MTNSIIDKRDHLYYGTIEFRGPVKGLKIDASELDITPEDIGAATEAQGELADTAIQGVTAGENITIDNTDPKNPVISSSGGGAVASVNGQTGAIVLTAENVGALPDTYTPPAQSWNVITNKPAVIAAGATQAEARTAIGAGTSSLSLTGAGGNNGSSSNAARADHTHASIAGVPSINSAAITITSGAGTVDLSARQNFYCDIIENTVLTLSGIIYNVEYTIDVVNTDTVQHTISIDGVNYIGNQDFSIPPGKGAVISIKQLSSTRPLRAVISVEPA